MSERPWTKPDRCSAEAMKSETATTASTVARLRVECIVPVCRPLDSPSSSVRRLCAYTGSRSSSPADLPLLRHSSGSELFAAGVGGAFRSRRLETGPGRRAAERYRGTLSNEKRGAVTDLLPWRFARPLGVTDFVPQQPPRMNSIG